MNNLKKGMVIMGLFFVHSIQAIFGGDYAQIPYLIRLVSENLKRYQQLQTMIEQSKNREDYLRLIHQGIDTAEGIILNPPIENGKVWEELRTLEQGLKELERLYGKTPPSEESSLFKLHDQSVAESIKLINSSKDYAQKQEENSARVFIQAKKASPKGAQRMTAVTNSQILHALSQLIKINGQILKLQSEALAQENKQGKESVKHFNKINKELRDSLKNYKGDFKLPEF